MILTEEHQMIRDALRGFAAGAPSRPTRRAGTARQHFRQGRAEGLGRSSARYGVAVPEEYGGAGLDYVALALVLEEIAAGDGAHLDDRQRQQLPGRARSCMAYGNDAQKERVAEAARARRDARRVLPDRAARRLATRPR